MRKPVVLDGDSLSLSDLFEIAWARRPARIGREAVHRMKRSRAIVEEAARGDEPVYGVNTGFGALSEIPISFNEIRALQRNLILSHCCGVGEPLPTDAVRAMLVLRANVLARGHSGVRPLVARRLVELLNADICPLIPQQGSVGASGDLAPLAHLSAALMGEGKVFYQGRKLTARTALRKAGLEPLVFEAKEGLALVNGTQAMTAVGALALGETRELLRVADLAGAVSLDALFGTPRAFDPRIASVRPHPGQQVSAANLRRLLAESGIAASHRHSRHKVQDPYSLRCMPQVHGAARDVFSWVSEVLEREINSTTDNPLVFAETAEVLSGGNFHGQPVAYALDFLACALADIASISERRIEQLVNPQLSGLPAFLTEQGGLNSGFMMAQVTASALVSELKLMAVPASVDSIPSSANREDHVSMGMTSARKARAAVPLVRSVLAIEMLCAAQALEFRRPLHSGAGVEAAVAALRRKVRRLKRDRSLHRDIEAAIDLLRTGALTRAADKAAGGID